MRGFLLNISCKKLINWKTLDIYVQGFAITQYAFAKAYLNYFAIFTALVSRITVTFTWPGYVISVWIF